MATEPSEQDATAPGLDAGTVKYLRVLVSVLTVTMILGFIVIVALFVIRFSGNEAVALPEAITLPDGARATAFTQGADWFAVVTDDDRILIYDRQSGALRQTITIEAE
jgi:hypothetical protein